MSMNRIQFQLGLSMPEFLKYYGTQAQPFQGLLPFEASITRAVET